MLTDILRAIGNAKIPGLVPRGLAETGTTHLITETGSVPVTFSEASIGLKVSFRATLASAFPEVRRYVELAAQDYGFDVERSNDSLWVSAEVQRRSRVVDEIRELCRLALQIIDGANWLIADQPARTVWAALAHTAEYSEKGDLE